MVQKSVYLAEDIRLMLTAGQIYLLTFNMVQY